MKVKIGKYRTWVGPYQVTEFLLTPLKWFKVSEEKYDAIHDAIVERIPAAPFEWFFKTVQNDGAPRVKVRIDDYDTWNMDSTLAYIIYPMLLRLKEDKHGSPMVDDDDVPEHLRSTNAPPKENEWDCDGLIHERWAWVLDEMIWAFGQKNSDWEEQYRSGKLDIKFVPCTDDPLKGEFLDIQTGPNNTYKFDSVGYMKHLKRMENGFRLFGKYYLGLWD